MDKPTPYVHDSLKCRHLEIVDDNGKAVAQLQAAQDGAGLWIKSPNGDQVAIYAVEGQMAIGFYGHAEGHRNAMSLALTLNSFGLPIIQYQSDDGQTKHLTLDEIGRALGK